MILIERIIAGAVAAVTTILLIWFIREWRRHRKKMEKTDRAIHLIQAVDWGELPISLPLEVMQAVRLGDYDTVISLLSPYEPTWEGTING